VLLDVNALLLPARSRFPLASEVDRLRPGATLAVPSSVLGELDRLVLRGVPGARTAAALGRRFPRLPSVGRGDAAILEAAIRYRAWVVTADQDLADRLRSRGINVLVPRDRHRLELHRARAAPASRARPPPPS
jgi:rRNA-processing protein FCF1